MNIKRRQHHRGIFMPCNLSSCRVIPPTQYVNLHSTRLSYVQILKSRTALLSKSLFHTYLWNNQCLTNSIFINYLCNIFWLLQIFQISLHLHENWLTLQMDDADFKYVVKNCVRHHDVASLLPWQRCRCCAMTSSSYQSIDTRNGKPITHIL